MGLSVDRRPKRSIACAGACLRRVEVDVDDRRVLEVGNEVEVLEAEGVILLLTHCDVPDANSDIQQEDVELGGVTLTAEAALDVAYVATRRLREGDPSAGLDRRAEVDVGRRCRWRVGGQHILPAPGLQALKKRSLLAVGAELDLGQPVAQIGDLRSLDLSVGEIADEISSRRRCR
eukprot:COSAG05_NODE_515_length_9075_cov_121.644719_9_plen_176_part_00